MEWDLRCSYTTGQLSAAECSENIDSTIENQQKSPIDIREGYSRRFVLISRRPLAQQQARQDDNSSQNQAEGNS